MSLDIHLRFRIPREVLTLIDVIGMAMDEANDAAADDLENLEWRACVQELHEAIWRCLNHAGVTLEAKGQKNLIFYQGRNLTWEKELNIQPINAEGVVLE